MLVRETWSFILNNNPSFSVIGEAGSAEEAIDQIKLLKPDVVIMDINLPNMNGIDATHEIVKNSPETKVLGVSLHTQPTYAKKMIQKGASGYITKNSSREEMFEAIKEVYKGNKYICVEMKKIISDQMMFGDNNPTGINSLSQRELEVIALIKAGNSSKDIAAALYISVNTVEAHRYNILRKLNLKNSAALVNFINNSNIELVA
jgi:two-component system invasion response regulator UvrY